MRLIAILAASTALTSGCTHLQLRHSAVNQGMTLADIQQTQVLNNIAKLSHSPDSLPYLVIVGVGSAQVTDSAGLSALTFGWAGANSSGALTGTRAIAENWGMSPVLEPDRLEAMRCAYRILLRSGCAMCDECELCAECKLPMEKFLGKSMERSIPTGWFRVTRRKEMPKGAYHGHDGDWYAWVLPGGMDGLSRFTLTVLKIATAVQPTYLRRTVSIFGVPFLCEEERQLSDDAERLVTVTRCVNDRGQVKAVHETKNEAPGPSQYTVPRAAPGIQFYPQAR